MKLSRIQIYYRLQNIISEEANVIILKYRALCDKYKFKERWDSRFQGLSFPSYFLRFDKLEDGELIFSGEDYCRSCLVDSQEWRIPEEALYDLEKFLDKIEKQLILWQQAKQREAQYEIDRKAAKEREEFERLRTKFEGPKT